MKNIILLLLALHITISLHAQNPIFEWVKSNKGTNGHAYSMSVEMDMLGNIYTVGYFSGSVDFNPGQSADSVLTAANLGPSVYIQKLDINGNFIWVRSIDFGHGENEYCISDLHLDKSGNLYITGNFMDTVDIDPGTSVYTLVSKGGFDVYLLKLSPTGDFLWARSFGGYEYEDVVQDLTIDANGYVYSCGKFQGTVDFDPGTGVHAITGGSSIYRSAFINKLDSMGNFVWAKAFIHQDTLYNYGISIAYSIDVDSGGNIFCLGGFSGSIDFDPDTASVYNVSGGGFYIVKLNSNGIFNWVKIMTGGVVSPRCTKTDRHGNIYTVGSFRANTDFDPGSDNTVFLSAPYSWPYYGFIQKLDKNGDFIYAKSYGVVWPILSQAAVYPNTIIIDSIDNVYVSGYFRDSADLDPGPDTLIFKNHWPYGLSTSAYFQKLNTNGDLLWVGSLQGYYGISTVTDLILDNAGNLYATGRYRDTVDFDPGISVHNQISPNSTSSSYLLKLSQCHDLRTDYITVCDSITWLDGITYHQSNQSAYFTLPSSAGCDSIICLSLTIPVIDTTVNVSPNGVFGSNQSSASYQWLDCNNGYAALPGDTLQTFTPTVNGDYAVEINLYGCVDTSACMHIGNVGIEEIAESTIRLYPNPNSGKFILDLGDLRATEVRILNSLGQKIVALKDINSQYFDLDLKPGIYFTHIRTGKASKTIKFMVN